LEPYKKSDMWREALKQDERYSKAVLCLKDGARRFPPHLQLKVGISECQLDAQDHILFYGRRWVPDSEQLCISIIQAVHDSILTGHPGQEQIYMLVSCEYFWPNMSQDIRRFVQNCDVCGRTKLWRD
jgi:hypothetical protein